MTQQHFEALASDIGLTLRRVGQIDNPQVQIQAAIAVDELAGMIAATCATTNPRFDRQRFMDRIDQVRRDGLK